uniref:uncharacterized protein LOC120344759 n=1 Tax=Styela clava TaxID=7725 RepID=UPI00193A2A5F|nr:uncharacterized protein LOC120344759 [Styela clava]
MGSSGSKNSVTVPTIGQSKVSDLSFASLLRRLEEKQTEIERLKAANQAQREEIKKLKYELETSRISATIQKPISNNEQPNFNSSNLLTPEDVISSQVPQGNMPKIGDHVVSMWGASKWQYFTATIVGFDSSSLKYTIEWDDGDPTGRVIDYYNLALDKVPSPDQIGVGSKVLFHQGEYKQQEVHGVTRSGGFRWHQGEITKSVRQPDGTRKYQGKHTKGASDGKWVLYKDYSEYFYNYKIDDFRMPPNVFDILDSVTGPSEGTRPQQSEQGSIDVFISYAKVNSPAAIKNHEIESSLLPPSYEEVMIEELCDPRDIVSHLKEMGVSVYITEDIVDDNEAGLLEIVSALKRSKIFIACLSDEYASNDRCRMEFQYAKKTMRIPVIPLVVGTGSFQWKMTVVGLLIAGELYIHFKDKSVEGFKMNELFRSIKKHIPELQLKNVNFAATGNASLDLITTPGLTLTGAQLETGVPDIFFSYCWSNSKSAADRNQISKYIGNEWNDPREIADKLAQASGAATWIDIKRLESAADGMGMFGQIASAIGDCKAAVACVSNEYANSDNCRMELQYAGSSLQKPLIILVVGEGSEWKETVVGKVSLLGNATINMQNITSTEELDQKITEIKNAIFEVDAFEESLGDNVLRDESEKASSANERVVTLKKKKRAVKFFKEKSKIVTRSIVPTSPIKFKAPMIGDHVVCLHQGWAYYTATVVEFDPTDLVYTVDWDDGDPSGRVQSYQDVAKDVIPDSSEIGVGSIVIFPQGSYGETEGNNTGGERYHQGKITSIDTREDGITRYNGIHTKNKDDGKWVTFRGYNSSFQNLTLNQLRISPNAMDALMACKQAFNLNG